MSENQARPTIPRKRQRLSDRNPVPRAEGFLPRLARALWLPRW